MTDREKVIKGLERCKEGGSCDGCQYDIQSSKCIFLLHADSLALLKEQEAIIKAQQFVLNNACEKLKEQENSHETCTGVSSVQVSCNPQQSKTIVRYIPDKDGWRVGAHIDPSMFEHSNNTGKRLKGNNSTDWFCADGEVKE